MKDYELSTAFGRLRVFDEPLLPDYESELYDESESGEATLPEPTNDEIDSDVESKPEQIQESTYPLEPKDFAAVWKHNASHTTRKTTRNTEEKKRVERVKFAFVPKDPVDIVPHQNALRDHGARSRNMSKLPSTEFEFTGATTEGPDNCISWWQTIKILENHPYDDDFDTVDFLLDRALPRPTKRHPPYPRKYILPFLKLPRELRDMIYKLCLVRGCLPFADIPAEAVTITPLAANKPYFQ